jgi:sugar fermentation stimulation protein A
MLLMKLDNLIEGQIIKRPSKIIKTPYIADISVNDVEYLAHTPALGCCGLSDVGSKVMLTPSLNTKSKSNYVVQLASLPNNQYVGINPKLAENLVENCLLLGAIRTLHGCKSFQREVTRPGSDSRFDFVGTDQNGIEFIMEVKNVPLADFEDVTARDRKKMDFTGRDPNTKVAYFPDGYRKKTTEPVSPRALKHIRELTRIKKEEVLIRCIMCYVIQRTDANRFTTSVIDPEYKRAVKEAYEEGIQIITLQVDWNEKGEARFVRDDLPFIL